MVSAIHHRIVSRVLEREGGIRDVGDGKGLTRFGQTPEWLKTWRLDAPKTPAEAAGNYLVWMQLTRLEDLASIDEDLGDVVIDWAVISGEETPIAKLQKHVGVRTDGRLGPITLAAVEAWATAGRCRQLARLVLADREEFNGRLLGSQKVDRREWAAGWGIRIAAQARRLAADPAAKK